MDRPRRSARLPPLELTWVCCGVDYPQLVEGDADYVLYAAANPWDHAPGSLLLAEAGGSPAPRRPPLPPGDPLETDGRPAGLLAAADRAMPGMYKRFGKPPGSWNRSHHKGILPFCRFTATCRLVSKTPRLRLRAGERSSWRPTWRKRR